MPLRLSWPKQGGMLQKINDPLHKSFVLELLKYYFLEVNIFLS